MYSTYETPFAGVLAYAGTGKTHTVVRILALLVEQALGSGHPPPY